MKPRVIVFTPQARQDMRDIAAWYKQTLGSAAAAKTTRTIAAGIRAASTISIESATRPDLPEGYFRVVAKAHLVIFQIQSNTARIVRIAHGSRDIAPLLENT